MEKFSASYYKGSLLRNTLSNMGLRIAIVIILITTLSYWHISNLMRERALDQLMDYVEERGQREQTLFSLAQDNHLILKSNFVNSYNNIDSNSINTKFGDLAERQTDGAVRNRADGFDGIQSPGIFIDEALTITDEIKHRVVVSYDVLQQFGPAWHNQFQDTYITMPENIMVIYWPEVPTWAQDADTELFMPDEEYVWIADEEHNPDRKSVWTGLFFDHVAKVWMVSLETPVYIDNKLRATIGHDIMLNEFFERTLTDAPEGAYNIIVRNDGSLIAHPEFIDNIKEQGGSFHLSKAEEPELQSLYGHIQQFNAENKIIYDEVTDNYLVMTQIKGPDWLFITAFPTQLIRDEAFSAARFILIIGAISLIVELLILYLVLKRQVAIPLNMFVRATKEITEGNTEVNLPVKRKDELGKLASSFYQMLDVIQQHDQQLKEHANSLDQQVKDRTAALQKKTREAISSMEKLKIATDQLVQSEKMAALGGLVAGVSHEINTPVGTSLTAASTLKNRTLGFQETVNSGKIKQSELLDYARHASESTDLICANLERAAGLINGFKELAVDQTGDQKRKFDLRKYLDDLIITLKPRLEQTRHQVEVTIPEGIEIFNYPGALAQVVTNLTMNSIVHAFDEDSNGLISIRLVKEEQDNVIIEFSDNGKGMTEQARRSAFDPFFTTRRSEGGSGLGLHIVYNIVNQVLGGTIKLTSVVDQGTQFVITMSKIHIEEKVA